MKDFCDYLNSLKPKFIEKTQKIYDKWERTKEEEGVNTKSKTTEHILSNIMEIVKDNLPKKYQNQDIIYQIFGLYDKSSHIRIMTGNEMFKIIVPSNIYEKQNNKMKWEKVENVKFNNDHFIIRCQKEIVWQDIRF